MGKSVEPISERFIGNISADHWKKVKQKIFLPSVVKFTLYPPNAKNPGISRQDFSALGVEAKVLMSNRFREDLERLIGINDSLNP